MDSQPTLASNAPLIERLERIPDLLTERLLKTEEKRKIFFSTFGTIEDFAAGRVFDLTASITTNDPNNPGPLVKSLHALNAKLFPIESERETPSGLKAYVQPDRTDPPLSMNAGLSAFGAKTRQKLSPPPFMALAQRQHIFAGQQASMA